MRNYFLVTLLAAERAAESHILPLMALRAMASLGFPIFKKIYLFSKLPRRNKAHGIIDSLEV